MANGFKSCHPVTVELLKQLGVADSDVTQGVGNASASAGTHKAVGKYGGVTYGPCIDLKHKLASRDFIARCWEAGLVAFVRDAASGWSGSRHIHAVCLGLVDDAGNRHLPPIVETQVRDFLASPPRSGLVGHYRLRGSYVPTPAQQRAVRRQYQAWWPGYATQVLSPEGHRIPCYAQLEGDTVMAEANTFGNFWGQPNLFLAIGGTSDGRFYRAPIRALAAACGLHVAGFTFNRQRTACTVRLGYGKGGAK